MLYRVILSQGKPVSISGQILFPNPACPLPHKIKILSEKIDWKNALFSGFSPLSEHRKTPARKAETFLARAIFVIQLLKRALPFSKWVLPRYKFCLITHLICVLTSFLAFDKRIILLAFSRIFKVLIQKETLEDGINHLPRPDFYKFFSLIGCAKRQIPLISAFRGWRPGRQPTLR